jgi:hypothetical protein
MAPRRTVSSGREVLLCLVLWTISTHTYAEMILGVGSSASTARLSWQEVESARRRLDNGAYEPLESTKPETARDESHLSVDETPITSANPWDESRPKQPWDESHPKQTEEDANGASPPDDESSGSQTAARASHLPPAEVPRSDGESNRDAVGSPSATPSETAWKPTPASTFKPTIKTEPTPKPTAVPIPDPTQNAEVLRSEAASNQDTTVSPTATLSETTGKPTPAPTDNPTIKPELTLNPTTVPKPDPTRNICVSATTCQLCETIAANSTSSAKTCSFVKGACIEVDQETTPASNMCATENPQAPRKAPTEGGTSTIAGFVLLIVVAVACVKRARPVFDSIPQEASVPGSRRHGYEGM